MPKTTGTKHSSSKWRQPAEQLNSAKPEESFAVMPQRPRLAQAILARQIELEAQNKALQEAGKAAETNLAHYRQLFHCSPIAIISLASGGIIRQSNSAAGNLLGVDWPKLAGRNLAGFISNEYHPVNNRFLEQVFTFDGAHTCELILSSGKNPVWVSMTAAAITAEQQTCLISLCDVSTYKAYERALQLEASIYLTLKEAVMVVDENNRIVLVNPAFTRLTGYGADEAIGQTTALLKSGWQDGGLYREIRKRLDAGGNWQGEIWSRRKDGRLYLANVSISTVHDDGGKSIHWVITSSDITEQKRLDKAIKHDSELMRNQANIDPLTGLPNRRLFMDRLQRAVNLSHRSGLKCALMFMDLDHFKEINDTLGHDFGDCLLKEASKRLIACIRKTDTLARLGGDEFTLVMGELNEVNSIDRVAQGFLKTMAAPFQLTDERSPVSVSISIGIALYPDDATTPGELMRRADQAMYAAKEQGRHRFCYFTPALQAGAEHRLFLANDLRGALAENQIWLAYQPIMDLKSGMIKKAEALIRWQHSVRGAVSPDEFIGIAQDTGMMAEIGKWVFHQVAAQVAVWRNTLCPEFQISLNKSPAEFHDHGNKPSEWFEYLHQLGLPGQSIAIEITEALLLDDSAVVAEKLLAFKRAGVQVSLDDFGTGYSSLSLLKKSQIDYLKIDKTNISHLTTDSTEAELCKVIIKMAHILGLQVIAERMETKEQYDLLMAAECDYGQGFFFSEPLSAVEFENLYHSNRLKLMELENQVRS